ncbi:BatA domain-containing protein [Sphingomonas sp. A2-49]|uniref:BatA domain-containing protein n=1 Tax=Sphingomonas sp. A2-49 TaxID=1391375 RepID=UPI0021D3442C|nr:BatA domain-containing protein [Sphingomonas sp. A2-49]MCU6452464.1 BatA domain-containing protein [Sphingomonas sp. A2-49]
MTLLFPLGLAALASLLLPLLIHLARRTEQRPTDFAALRWLRQKPRPRHRPRFDELPLLAIRLLLLAAIALVLAQPVRMAVGETQAVVAVLPGARIPADTGARRIWLAPGFPPISARVPDGPLPTGSLIRQLDAELPPRATLTIVVPRILDGADAERPRVSRPVVWRIAGEGRAPGRPIPPPLPRVQGDPAAPGMRYVVAALRAAGGSRPSTGGPVIRLAPGPLPAALVREVEAGRTVLVAATATVPAAPTSVVWRDDEGAPLVEAQSLGRGRLLRFVRPLTPRAMPQLLEPGFPDRLLALFAAPAEPTRALADAYRPQPGAAAPAPPARPVWPWLAVAVAIVFLVERWLATRPTRVGAR